MRFVILIFMSLADGVICSRALVSVFREAERPHAEHAKNEGYEDWD